MGALALAGALAAHAWADAPVGTAGPGPAAVFPGDSAASVASRLQSELAARVEHGHSSHEIGPVPAADADIYRLYVSSQDGPHCTFKLTCSGYAKEAVRKRGWLMGALLAADRLLRCHGLSATLYPVDAETGRFVDPVP